MKDRAGGFSTLCLAVISVLAVIVPGCAPGPEDPADAAGWSAFVEERIEEHFRHHPDMAVNAGRHEFDGQLPDWSREGLGRLEEDLLAARDKALSFDEGSLSPDEGFERRYLVSRIDEELFWLTRARWPYKNPMFYSRALEPSVYLTRPYAPAQQRLKAFTAYLRALPTALTQMRANLETPLPRTYAQLGANVFGGMASYFEDDVAAIFSDVTDPAAQQDLLDASAPAVAALRELATWFEEGLATATEDFALGAELFSDMLRDTEGVDVSLERLKEVGEADLERNLKALAEACEKIVPGQPTEVCIAQVQSKKPQGGPVAGARRQLAGLKGFVMEQELVTIPGTEEALVEEAPPYNRWNFAYIDIPGPYEDGLPSVYYIAPPDPEWSPEERQGYLPGEADLLFVSAHEVWPGHFLNYLHANRSPSKFGRVFVGYAFAEGWGHYTEEMMWEAGLGDGDPVTHVGQLLNALLRNVRFLSAIGLHTEGMSFDESFQMFLEKGHQDPGNARQQAARGTFDPAYLNYTMGKLMIRKLRQDWTASRGGREAWREFHDKFLSYGGPPIPLVREAMMGGAQGELF